MLSSELGSPSTMEDETLILCVQHRSSIYNKKDPLHHNRDHIQKQWEAVAQEMKCEVNAVKSRWGHIRDYFLKKRREYKNVKSGQAATGKKKWHLYDALSFLIPVYEQRDTASNLSQEEDSVEFQTSQATESITDSQSQASSPMIVRADSPPPQAPFVPYKRPQKRKSTASAANDVDAEILKSLQQPEYKEDDDDLWARSIVPSMRKLGHLEKLEFRVEVQSLLLRYLRRQDEGARASYGQPSTSHGACDYGSSSTVDNYYQNQWTG